jgi:hypothetical protein
MPLVFIHGVNTRDTDPDYFVGKEARRKQFIDIVAPTMVKRFPSFQVLDDIYWGDLGVRFRWNLGSVPKTKPLESLGPEAAQSDNPALLQLIADPSASPAPRGGASALETLGGPAQSGVLLQKFNALIRTGTPGDVVRSVFAPEAGRFDPSTPSIAGPVRNTAELQAQGEQLSLLLRAAGDVARQVDSNPRILGSPQNDNDLLDAIKAQVYTAYGNLIPPTDQVEALGLERLGLIDDAKTWAVNRLNGLMDGAKAVLTKVSNTPARAATLLAMQGWRDQVSDRGLRFLGDVFVYLHQGSAGNIAKRVTEGVRKAWQIAVDNKEPLVIVTHSFGSEILYDALTSGTLDDIKIKLWASAGAQTSLFAEMALYKSSDSTSPTPPPPSIPGKPAQVQEWINFYDAADILSYLHRPVFHDVTDIQIRYGGNISNAHGHYFVTPEFYEEIEKALR